MDRQEVFNKVRDHLLTQNRRATDPETGRCRYRGAEGTMCAFGCLIPDELYTPELENITVTGLFGLKYEELVAQETIAIKQYIGIDGQEDIKFLNELQLIHDHVDVSLWPSRLNLFAREWNLQS